MTTAIKAQAMFNNLVTELEKVYGDQMKTNVQLLEIGKAILPEMRDVIRNSDVDLLNKEPQYLIVNTNNRSGLHWVGVYISGKKIFVFDTFARKTTNIMKTFVKRAEKAGFAIIETRKRIEQADAQQDCGLRSLAWLIILVNKGIRFAMLV